MYADVLQFWFEQIEPSQWWTSDPALDETIRQRFAEVHNQALQGELSAWRQAPKGRLAEIIVLDQFSRNLERASPKAFAQDLGALVLAQEAVRLGVPNELKPVENSFLLLPYMHSESRQIHVLAEQLYRQYTPPFNLVFELKHKAIIDRFGRYPHRNEVLGRSSTPDEIEFLKTPGSSF